MSNDNKPTLRVVGSEKAYSERQREMLSLLRSAISKVESDEAEAVMISVVEKNEVITNMASESEVRHHLVAAAVYHLFALMKSSDGH